MMKNSLNTTRFYYDKNLKLFGFNVNRFWNSDLIFVTVSKVVFVLDLRDNFIADLMRN